MIEILLVLMILILLVTIFYLYKIPSKKDIDKMLSNAYHKGFEDGIDKAKQDVQSIETSKIFDESVTVTRLNALAKKQKKKPKKKR